MANDELLMQLDNIIKIKEINEREFEKTGRRKYYYNFVMGCQMNAHDSEKLSGMLNSMGYIETQIETKADFIIYNTCCIRENAENKVYGKLGYLKNYKQKNPNLMIALCGCMMQQESVIENIKKRYNHVDIIFGTFNLYKLPELILSRLESGHMIIDIWKEHKEIIEDLPSIRNYKYKACVNIMYGCNNFCTYCIVPYVRGRERSRKPEEIISEIKSLVKDGVKEIMLLGQNVNSYGKGLEENITFADLLREVNKIDGLERIRFMTSHPKDLSDELISAMAECDKVCKYLHLPIQSGSSDILKKMNRNYTKEKYLALIDKLKKAMPDIFISTDIIIGFPGETEEDFLDTLDVIEKVRFSNAFTFIYSKREGTPAAKMEDQVPEDIIKNRFDRLLKKLNPIVEEVHSPLVGRTFKTLVEEINHQNPLFVTGRLDNMCVVHFEGSKDLVGEFVDVRITQNKGFYLIGEMINEHL